MNSRGPFAEPVAPTELEMFFREPLSEIFQKKRRRDATLSEAELEYVIKVLTDHVLKADQRVDGKPPLHLCTVSDRVNAFWLRKLSLQESIELADSSLLLIGFFHRQASHRRGRREYPIQFYAETGQAAYWNHAAITGKPFYGKLSDHFFDWLSALWLLANVFRRRSLERYLID